MNKLLNWLQESFTPKANRIFQIPVLAAVSTGMQRIIPFILTGSIVFFYNVFQSYFPSLPDISPVADFSFGLISMVVAFFISQQMMEKLDLPQYGVNVGMVSVLTFIMICLGPYEDASALQNFLLVAGPSGILIGMLTALFVSTIFYLYKKIHLFENTTTVPEFIISWLDAIIPTFVILLLTMLLVIVNKIDLFKVAHQIFQPFFSFGQTLPGMLFCVFVPVFFYTLGVSTWFWGAFTAPIFLAGIQGNIDAVKNGMEATNIVTNEVCISSGLVAVGGAGSTMILVLLMMFSKSKTLRIKGRIFLGPSLFNINEPVVFGAPIIMNPVLMIPMWLCAIIGPIVLWFIFKLELLNIPSAIMQIAQIPVPFSTWLVTQDMRAFLWFAVLVGIYLIIWYPFFKTYENSVLKEEAEEEAQLDGK